MFKCNCKEEVKEIRAEIQKLEDRQMKFLIHAQEVLKSIMDNDKRKFMYELRQEDTELIADGKKLRSIRKIIE